MPTFVGFSTVEVNQPLVEQRPGAFGGIGTVQKSPRLGRKFRLTDEQLVIRDLLNALSIRQGDKVGQPTYGTTIWSYVFEPQTPDTRQQIEDEIRRVIGQDPRIVLNSVGVYFQENGVLIQIECYFNPFNQATQVGFFLNRFNGSISQNSQ